MYCVWVLFLFMFIIIIVSFFCINIGFIVGVVMCFCGIFVYVLEGSKIYCLILGII